MPNGHDKNWFRLCGALDGFYMRYGRWPRRVREMPVVIDSIRDLFSPELWDQLTSRVEIIAAGDGLVAEDDSGGSYDYWTEGFPDRRPRPSAREWLGVAPDRGHEDDW